MPFVRTFSGYSPPGRADGVKWTTVRIEEGAGPDALVQIDEQVIPDYPNPAAPPLMNFTTNDAVLDPAWYRLVFVDPSGAIAPTTPEAAGTSGVFLPPSAEEVRHRSALLQSLLPSGVGTNDEKLREAVLDAKALVESLTCRSLDGTLGDARLDRLAMRAVTLKTERIAQGEATARSRKGALSNLQLKSMTAGPYSETYFGPDQAASLKVLDPDPATHEVLWALATPECREAWQVLWGQAISAPWSGTQSFDYGARTSGRGY